MMISPCNIGTFTKTSCGISSHYPKENECSRLNQCNRDISTHLLSLKLGIGQNNVEPDVPSEGHLISLRAGLFPYSGSFTVCPKHRYDLGLYWRQKRTCQYPGHTGKCKPSRTVSSHMSVAICKTKMCLVPVGSGICRKCLDTYKRDIDVPDTSTFNSLLQKSSPDRNCEITEEEQTTAECENNFPNHQKSNSTEKTLHMCLNSEISEDVYNLRERSKVTYQDELYITSSQESILTLSQGSNWSATSAAEQHLKSSIENVNSLVNTLGKGHISPIKYQLTTPLENVSQSTKRYIKRKSNEAVNAVLNSIAPGQSAKLLRLINQTEDTKKGSPTTNDSSLIQLIIKLYQDESSNAVKCQLLSMIASSQLHSKVELQTLIPGLTKWKIDQSRAHAARIGAGILPSKENPSYRDRMDEAKLDHALSFFSDPNYIEICSYGTRTLKFDNGDEVVIPEVVRTVCHSSLIVLYKAFCVENQFRPLSDSTLYKILSTCSAAKRSNLTGLDNISADGTAACNSLIKTVETLIHHGLSKDDAYEIKSAIKTLKLYLKAEYKVNLESVTSIEDHCVKYALSNTRDLHLQDLCSHNHDGICGKCGLLDSINTYMHNALSNVQDAEVMEDARIATDHDIVKIEEWKSHILRAKNQNDCRYDLMESLEPHQMILVLDWAMKFLPLLFREKQEEFFGQKGLNWHVTVGLFRCEDGSLKHQTFVHLLNGVKQDWFAVASILEHTLKTIKTQNPSIEEVYIRSDNAGCYHCGMLWIALDGIGKRTGIKILRYDYSEAQAGKSFCDSKIAHMRCKMKMFVSSGGNIQSAEDMKTAIMSGSGVAGCHCAVVMVDETKKTLFGHNFKGVNSISNLEFQGEWIVYWQAYNIGIGRRVLRRDILRTEQGETGLEILSNFIEQPALIHGVIHSIRPNNKSLEEDQSKNASQDDDTTELKINHDIQNAESSADGPIVFHCPEAACIKTYTSHSSLDRHILEDRHVYETPPKMSTYDQIRKKWTQTCYANLEVFQRICENDNVENGNNSNDNSNMGWALKKQRKYGRFSPKVKDYLKHAFEMGKKSGRKLNPSDVCQAMKLERNDQGERLFVREECLSTSQINSYFSKLSLMDRKGGKSNDCTIETLDEEQVQSIVGAIEEEELRNSIHADIASVDKG